MTIFTLKPQQSIWVGEEVKVCNIRVRNGRVYIGIDAPIEIPVHREEIYEKIIQQAKMKPRMPVLLSLRQNKKVT